MLLGVFLAAGQLAALTQNASAIPRRIIVNFDGY